MQPQRLSPSVWRRASAHFGRRWRWYMVAIALVEFVAVFYLSTGTNY